MQKACLYVDERKKNTFNSVIRVIFKTDHELIVCFSCTHVQYDSYSVSNVHIRNAVEVVDMRALKLHTNDAL